MNESRAATCQAAIMNKQRQIGRLNGEIDEIARREIPDFHFLNYKVSTFWTCDDSPIGMCVWVLDEGRFHLDCRCRYCGGPVERK